MIFRCRCLLLLFLAGCDGSRPPAEILEQGRSIYNFRCYFCHGYSGNARTLAASYMQPAPRDFTRDSPTDLPPERILAAVRDGRPGSGMKSFAGIISESEMQAVSAFVFDEFVLRKAANTRYHTEENGWPQHERYGAAFPFAQGEISLTQDPETLSEQERRGRALFLGSCVTCHDRGKPGDDPVVFESRALSFPRNNYDHRNPVTDATTSATPYHLHERPPVLVNPSPAEQRGEGIFQANCAFCHAADGTGKNWIGSFLEPHPRNLADRTFMAGMTRDRLRTVIREGLGNTSMPAWKSVLSEEEIEAVIAYIDKVFHLGPA